jgi:hypothetical protein
MNRLPIITEDNTVPSELVDDRFYIQKYDEFNREFQTRQSDFQHNIKQYNRDISYLENSIYRYWNAQNQYANIENNEFRKYKELEDAQNSLLDDINNKNYPCGLRPFEPVDGCHQVLDRYD